MAPHYDDDLEVVLGETFDRATDAGREEAERAIRTLTAARRILKNSKLMGAVRDLLAEQRAAVKAAGKEGADDER